MSDYEHLELERSAGTTTVWLNRPEVLNAFNAALIDELQRAFIELSEDDETRAVILAGRGKAFCAGADINWMRESIDYSRQQNVDDATAMARMMQAIATCAKPVVASVHGLAIGGGLGLIAAADYVVADRESIFAFSEVKLGIVPAAISPFVLTRIGPGHARPLFLTGERFDAERACRIGLVHVTCDRDRLTDETGRVVAELMTSAPDAITVAKRLVEEVSYKTPRQAMAQTVETIATKRTSREGQEGLAAFLERRRPSWMLEDYSPGWVKK